MKSRFSSASSSPTIQGTLLTVTTTIVIFSLKLFDIVRVMTGGNNGTNVIANEFYLQRFTYGNAGRASAIAIVLLIGSHPGHDLQPAAVPGKEGILMAAKTRSFKQQKLTLQPAGQLDV